MGIQDPKGIVFRIGIPWSLRRVVTLRCPGCVNRTTFIVISGAIGAG